MTTQAEKMLVIEAAFVKQARVIDDLKVTVSELQRDRAKLRDAVQEIAELKRHVNALTVSESIAKRKAETMEFLLAKERGENDRYRRERVEGIMDEQTIGKPPPPPPTTSSATPMTAASASTTAQRGRLTASTAIPRANSAGAPTSVRAAKNVSIGVKSISHLESNFDSAQKKVLTGAVGTAANKSGSADLQPPNVLRQQSIVNPLAALPTARAASNADTLNALADVRQLKFAGCSTEDESYIAATGGDELVHLVASTSFAQLSGKYPAFGSKFVCQFAGRRSVFGKDRAVFRLGSLHSTAVMLPTYLQEQLGSGKYFRVSELLSMLLDVAEGVSALHRDNVMHGNLCPQNVAYVSGPGVRGGQGPESALAVTGYGCTPVAKNFRYMAPEGLEQPTAPGDVWAFGVLAWELCQYCAVSPLAELRSRKQFLEGLQSGLRLKCPEQCPPNIFLRVIRPCFSELTQRPSMDTIVVDITDLLQQVQ